MSILKSRYAMVGGTNAANTVQLVWPAAAPTLTVFFRAGKDRAELPNGYKLVVRAGAAVADAALVTFDASDEDGVTGSANGVPASVFFADSRVNNFRMRAPTPAPGYTAVFALPAGPVADTPFTACLMPPDAGEPSGNRTLNPQLLKKVMPAAVKKVARKAAKKAGPRGLLRRVGGGIKKLGKGLLNVLYGVGNAGSEADVDRYVEDNLGDVADLLVGDVADLLVGEMEEMGAADWEELAGEDF